MKKLLPPNWQAVLAGEFKKPYFLKVEKSVHRAYCTEIVYPPLSMLFNAFLLTPFSQVKVVVLGQDPYHGLGQAHGLAFSVPAGVTIPPSLRNIYHEIARDIGISTPQTGDLSHWAKQGVLLLNTILTVQSGCAASHHKFGWEQFTKAVITNISKRKSAVVFILWGKSAHSKKPLIDDTKHLILSAPHPSPLSAYKGFFGCRHFSQTNHYLCQTGQSPIIW